MRRLEKTTESEERRFTTCQLQALCMLRVLFANSPEFMSDMMNPKFTQLILLIFLITILNFTESSKYLEYCSNDQQCEAGLVSFKNFHRRAFLLDFEIEHLLLKQYHKLINIINYKTGSFIKLKPNLILLIYLI